MSERKETRRVEERRIEDREVTARQEVRDFVERFNQRFPPKVFAGSEEHQANLKDHSASTLAIHLEDEHLDSWAYLQALREKLKEFDRLVKIKEAAKRVYVAFGQTTGVSTFDEEGQGHLIDSLENLAEIFDK